MDGPRLRAGQHTGDECQVHLADDLRSCLSDVTEGAIAKDHIVARGGRLITDDAKCGQQPTAAVTCPRPPSDLTAILGGNIGERLQRRSRRICLQSLGQNLGSEVVPSRRDRHLELETGRAVPLRRMTNTNQPFAAFVGRLDEALRKKLLQMEGGQPHRDSDLLGDLDTRERAARGPYSDVSRPSCRIVQHAQPNNGLVEVVAHTSSNTTSPLASGDRDPTKRTEHSQRHRPPPAGHRSRPANSGDILQARSRRGDSCDGQSPAGRDHRNA